jgi:hypothetical protein
MQKIAIPATTDIKDAIKVLKKRYKLLDDVEIIKLALSEAIGGCDLAEELDVEDSLSLIQAKKDTSETLLQSEQDIDKHFSKLSSEV